MLRTSFRSIHKCVVVVSGFLMFTLCAGAALGTQPGRLRSSIDSFYTEAMRFLVTVHRWLPLPNQPSGGHLAGFVSFPLVMMDVMGIMWRKALRNAQCPLRAARMRAACYRIHVAF